MVAYIDEDEVVVELADYFAHPMRLSTPEALTLLAGALAMLSTGQAPAALERAAAKLQAAVIPNDPDALTVDLSEPELVGVLRDSAETGRVVAISYVGLSSGRRTERDIEPWSVFSTLGNWYVRAHCRLADGERVFRVDRIREATVTEAIFDVPDEVPPPVVRYTPNEADSRATIRLGARARWVAEYYPVEIIEDGKDQVTVVFSAGDPGVAARLLLRLGADAELLDGDEVRGRLTELKGRILTRYERDSTDGLLAK
jgi:proteasome accessory factor C